MLLHYILQNNYLNKSFIFFRTHYTKFWDHSSSGTSNVLTSEVRKTAVLVLLMVKKL